MEETFESKFGYTLILLLLFLGPIFALPIAAGVLGLIENINGQEPFKEFGFTIIMPLVFLALLIHMILHYALRTPKIRISKSGIRIGNAQINFMEIKNINVRENVFANYLWIPYPQESCVIETEAKEWVIPVENYSNGHLIRTNLAEIKKCLKGEKSTFKIYQKSFVDTKSKFYEFSGFCEYRQSIFRFFNFYMFGLLILMFLSLGFAIRTNLFLSIFGGTFALLIYCALGVQTHYFLISDTYLVVKNLLLPFRYFAFDLKDIKVVESEWLPKQETALKVITTDYKIRRFQSGLLNDEMFSELITKASLFSSGSEHSAFR